MPVNSVPNDARHALLRLACAQVDQSIVNTCTICIDPSYPDYVSQLSTVAHSKGARGIEKVDWEPIFHAMHPDKGTESDPAHRRFRLFTAATGTLHPLLGELLSVNSIAVTLVECALSESTWTPAIYSALEELHASLETLYEDETAFVSLACLLIAIRSRPDAVTRWAGQFKDDAFQRQGRHRPKAAFLWSTTNFRRAFPRWRGLIKTHLKAPELRAELLRDP